MGPIWALGFLGTAGTVVPLGFLLEPSARAQLWCGRGREGSQASEGCAEVGGALPPAVCTGQCRGPRPHYPGSAAYSRRALQWQCRIPPAWTPVPGRPRHPRLRPVLRNGVPRGLWPLTALNPGRGRFREGLGERTRWNRLQDLGEGCAGEFPEPRQI